MIRFHVIGIMKDRRTPEQMQREQKLVEGFKSATERMSPSAKRKVYEGGDPQRGMDVVILE